MIFERLVLHDFGPYRGQHTCSFEGTQPSRPVVLIGGLNGAGKTTLMDAIQLALFGKLARCSGRNGLSYDEYLSRSIHLRAWPRESRVQLHLRARSAGAEHTLVLDRSWTSSERGAREHFEVFRDGHPDQKLTESWHDHLELSLPSRLAELFFFDGERIEALADQTTAAGVLRSAVETLLGLDIVARLQGDLSVLQRRKQKLLVSTETNRAVEKIEMELQTLEGRRAELVQDQGSAQVLLDQTARDLADVETRFQRDGGGLFQQRIHFENQQVALAQQAESTADALREIAAGAAPLVIVEGLLNSVQTQAARESASFQQEAVQTALTARDEQLLRALEDARIPKSALGTVRHWLEKDRIQRLASNDAEFLLRMTDAGRDALAELRRSTLTDVVARSQVLIDQYVGTQSELDAAASRLAATPSEEVLEEISARLDSARARHRDAEVQFAIVGSELTQVRTSIQRCEETRSRLLHADLDARNERDDAARSEIHIVRVKDTLREFREALLHRHLLRIEQLALDSFRLLIRKPHLVTGLAVNPDDFSITVTGADGAVLPPDRLSAGERQLLATAVLWGLRRASGRVVPLVIDTPLGRLDSHHRKNLITRYFPAASHQVVLLSTDEEIDRRYYEMLKPFVGAEYTLEYDAAADSSMIRTGYTLTDSEVVNVP